MSAAFRLALRRTPSAVGSSRTTVTGHQNRTIDKFYRETDENRQQPMRSDKPMTKLAGLHFLDEPHARISQIYGRLLRVLGEFPAEARYRQSTEAIVQSRLAVLKEHGDINVVEEKIGMGMIEEVHEQAIKELEAARLLLEAKCWEPLVEEAPADQWRWPI